VENDVLELKAQLQEANRRGLVLDIDDTIAKTAPYLLEVIYKDFGYPHNGTADDLLKKHGKYDQDFWKQTEIEEWFEQNVDSVTPDIPLVDNIHQMIQKVNQIIPIVGYLTAREERKRQITQDWLDKHNFPSVPLLMLPSNQIEPSGSKWKAKVLQTLYPEVIGIIDDNERLADVLPANYPGYLYLYDVPEYPRNDIKIIPCLTWDDIYTKVKEHHGTV
jgi:hypothetical protein